ncbi:MAG: MipA/OmpV family protein [Pelovirga sp.]
MKLMKLILVGGMLLSVFSAPVWATEHVVGLGVGVVPDYEGSEDSQGVPMWLLKGRYDSGRFFSLTGTNLKVNLVPSRNISFGPVVNYRQGRDDVDNQRVDAMRDIDDAFEVGGFADFYVGNWFIGTEILVDISDAHNGMLAKISSGYRWQATADLNIIPSLNVSYADNDYMDTYFGVNSSNRGGSTLPDFSAGKGVKNVGVNLNVDYSPWQQWGIAGFVAYSALLNDAKDSPIVAQEGSDQQLYIGLLATYRWGK